MKKHAIYTVTLLLAMVTVSFAMDKKIEKVQDTSIRIANIKPNQETEPFAPVSKCSKVTAEGRVAKCIDFDKLSRGK
jgi:hypothetical protein